MTVWEVWRKPRAEGMGASPRPTSAGSRMRVTARQRGMTVLPDGAVGAFLRTRSRRRLLCHQARKYDNRRSRTLALFEYFRAALTCASWFTQHSRARITPITARPGNLMNVIVR